MTSMRWTSMLRPERWGEETYELRNSVIVKPGKDWAHEIVIAFDRIVF